MLASLQVSIFKNCSEHLQKTWGILDILACTSLNHQHAASQLSNSFPMTSEAACPQPQDMVKEFSRLCFSPCPSGSPHSYYQLLCNQTVKKIFAVIPVFAIPF